MENVERLGFRALMMESVDRLVFSICWVGFWIGFSNLAEGFNI